MYKYRIKGIGKKRIITSPVKLYSPYLELVWTAKDSAHLNGVISQDEQSKPNTTSQT